MNEFAMHDAAGNGDLERMTQLIEAGVPVDSLDEEGETPLHRAVQFGRYEVAGLLIDSKCNINLKDRRGHTPVMWAAFWGRKDIVDLLLHRGAKVSCADDHGQTLLHWISINNGWTDILNLILNNGEADLNAVDKNGNTPLIWAIWAEEIEGIAAILIRAGADVNRSGTDKRTALHWAVKNGNTRVIQFLLETEGLDLGSQDINGDTPLHLACHYYCHRATDHINRREVIKLLLDAGVDINMKNNRGKTALSEGIWEETLTTEAIRLFVQKGAFLENRDYYVCMYRSSFLMENVLKDVELCTQYVVNKFNRQSLPALNRITYFARRLPNVNNFKLRAQHHIDEVKNLVKCEIERKTFCNMFKVHPISLSALCVLSLITCQ